MFFVRNADMGEARLVAPPVLSVQDFDRLNKEREKQMRFALTTSRCGD